MGRVLWSLTTDKVYLPNNLLLLALMSQFLQPLAAELMTQANNLVLSKQLLLPLPLLTRMLS